MCIKTRVNFYIDHWTIISVDLCLLALAILELSDISICGGEIKSANCWNEDNWKHELLLTCFYTSKERKNYLSIFFSDDWYSVDFDFGLYFDFNASVRCSNTNMARLGKLKQIKS